MSDRQSTAMEQMSSDELMQALRDTMHEVREFNRIVKANSEMLTRQLRIEEDGPLSLSTENARNIRGHATSILETSQMLSARLDLIDLETNPDAFVNERRISLSVYGKFEKSRKMLKSKSQGKRSKITISGESYSQSELYPVFDIVPFLILENAVKYAPRETDIHVSFSERPGAIDIVIDSIGPHVKADEIDKLTDKNYRGTTAKEAGISGTGFGLYFAKFVCALNDIDLKISSSGDIYNINGVPHSNFKVSLRIPRPH